MTSSFSSSLMYAAEVTGAFFQTAVIYTVHAAKETYVFLKPHAISTAQKCQELWIATQPYLNAYWHEFSLFMRSPLGIASTLLGTTIILMKLSQITEEKYTSLFLMTLGIAAAVTCGAFLLQAGVFPQALIIADFPQKMT